MRRLEILKELGSNALPLLSPLLFATAVQGSFALLISQIDEALVAVHELSHKPHAVCQGTYGDSYRFFQL